MRIVRDLLDAEVVDGQHNPLGKVDGIVLELRPRGRPRIAALQIGAPVLARRIRWPLGKVIGRVASRWHAQTMTIPWTRVRGADVDVQVVLAGEQPESRGWERWLAGHVVARIPGGG